jgi:hypothetical protein
MLVATVFCGLAAAVVNTSFFATVNVITLHPERAERLARQLSSRPLIWPGVNYTAAHCPVQRPFQGCTLAHARVLHAIGGVASPKGQWHLVFEDDAVPTGWAIANTDWPSLVLSSMPSGGIRAVNLGPSEFSPSVGQIIRGPLSALYRYAKRHGSAGPVVAIPEFGRLTHAYMITPVAAREMRAAALGALCRAPIDITFDAAAWPWAVRVYRGTTTDHCATCAPARSLGIFAQFVHDSDIDVERNRHEIY